MRITFFLHEADKLLHKVFTQTNTPVLGQKNKISQLHLFSPMLGHQATNDAALVLADPNFIFSRIILPGKIFKAIQYIGLKVKTVAAFLRIQVAMYIGNITKVAR